MTFHNITTQSPTNVSKFDFAEWFRSFQCDNNWTPFAVTLIHKAADTPRAAFWSLRSFVPRFFSKTISPNWHRASYINSFVMWMFLESPGSKHRNHANPYELASAQDSYHHHGVLLIDPTLRERFESKARFLIVDDEQDSCPQGYSELQQSIAEGSIGYLRKWQRDMARAFLSFKGSSVRACHIKRIYDVHDWSTYAAKTIIPMLHKESDEAYVIFPQYVRDHDKVVCPNQ